MKLENITKNTTNVGDLIRMAPFEYGKYVVFMTLTEHSVYHNKGEKNPWYGKKCSEETREKMSAAHKGKKHSEETREKMSTLQQGNNNPMYGKQHSEETREKMSVKASAVQCGTNVLYTIYKENGGILKWNDFRKALSNGEITFEIYPITIYTNK